MLRRIVICAALAFFVGACGDSDECTTDADCPGQSVCSFSVCTIAANADGQGIIDIDLPCEPAQIGDLVLTEVLADPGTGDPNGDTFSDSSDDEFVEVVNVSDHEVGIANVLISVVAASTKQIQLGLVCLPAHEARVLFGKEKGLGLRNTSGTVSLLISGQLAQPVLRYGYGDENSVAATDDESLTLSDQADPTSAWVPHSEVSSEPWSPGTCPNGNSFPDCEADAPKPDVIDACGEAPDVGELVINEVMAHDDEFVEIVNRSLRPFSLDGLTVHDFKGERIAFPPGQCIEPGQALVIIKGYDPENSEDPITMMVPAGVLGFDAVLNLNNDGDTVSLRNADDVLLDEMKYGSGEEISSPNGESMTRLVQLDPASSWVKHSEAPFSDGAVTSLGTCPDGSAFPDCPSTVTVGDGETVDTDGDVGTGETFDVGPSCGKFVDGPNQLAINEVLIDDDHDANCDGKITGQSDEFIELVNLTNDTLDLSGVVISTGEADSMKVVHTFGAVCLEPSDGLVVFGSSGQVGALCEDHSVFMLAESSLSLLNKTGLQVVLTSSGDVELDRFSCKTDDGSCVCVDEVGACAFPNGVSMTRDVNAPGGFVRHDAVSPCPAFVQEVFCPVDPVEDCEPPCALEFSPGACSDGGALPFCL
jgi:hypothetical protein